jgi:anti-anti-sigma factor
VTPDATTANRVPLVEVIIHDELDVAAVPRLHSMLAQALELHPSRIVVDLAQCTRIDAAAIAELLDAHRQVHLAGGRLILRGPSPRLRRNLQLARVDRVLPVTPDDDVQPTAGADTAHPRPPEDVMEAAS